MVFGGPALQKFVNHRYSLGGPASRNDSMVQRQIQWMRRGYRESKTVELLGQTSSGVNKKQTNKTNTKCVATCRDAK